MGGYPCYKTILCSNNGNAAVLSVKEIALEKLDEGRLTDEEFKEVVEFLEKVEDGGNALAQKLSGTPKSTGQ